MVATLRTMQPMDVTQVHALETLISPDPWGEHLFNDCISVGYSCWVLVENNVVVGYGLLSCAVGEAHVLNIAIHPEKQRLGLGKKMMQHLIQQARVLQADMVYLEVRESNFPAISLYKQLEFIEIGVRKGYYARGNEREDALVFALGI